MQTIDFSTKADTMISRAVSQGLGDQDWRIRYRESGGPGKAAKETVGGGIASHDPQELEDEITNFWRERSECGDSTKLHVECLQTGKQSPFYTVTVPLRAPEDAIEANEGGAWHALATMGVRSNRLLYDLVGMLSGALIESRDKELQLAVLLAEIRGRTEAGDEGAKWETAQAAVENFAPAATAAAQGWEHQQASQRMAQERAAMAERAAAERAAAARAAEESEQSSSDSSSPPDAETPS